MDVDGIGGAIGSSAEIGAGAMALAPAVRAAESPVFFLDPPINRIDRATFFIVKIYANFSAVAGGPERVAMKTKETHDVAAAVK